MKYCFIGNEALKWQLSDFAKAAQSLNLNGYDTVVFKAGEGQSNLWYSDTDFKARYMLFQMAGLHPIPYLFLYGNTKGSDVASEAKICNHILSLCGEICLDMEDGWDGKPQDAKTLVQLLSKGIIHISTWANIVDHAWVDVLKVLAPISVSVWPQVYTSYLSGVWKAQYAGVTLPIYPTYAQATLPSSSNLPTHCGYWEIANIQKVPFMPITRNSKGENADVALITQYVKDETQFACSFYATAMCKYAGIPGKGPTGTPQQVHAWADAQYDAKFGSHGISQAGGTQISDMWPLLKMAGNLHFWDIAAINPVSQQASDIAHVRAALNAGYLVVVFVDEASIHDLDLGGANPYNWNPQPGQYTHTILLTGPGVPGSHLLAEDTANVDGDIYGVNTVRKGPRRYDEKWIGIQWASVVQLVGPDPLRPWHLPIPSADPTTWPAGFNCQNWSNPVSNWPSPAMQQQASDTWNASAKLLQALFTLGVISAPSAPYTTGIAQAWQERYKRGKNYGPPISVEMDSVDWSGKPMKWQLFAGGVRAEWWSWDTKQMGHFFDKDGEI